MSNIHTASCHCGNVQVGMSTLPATLTECNCSICHRYGARWAYFTRDQVSLVVGEAGISCYSWGDRTIEFYHCDRCGCLTHYESMEKQENSRFAVNARMLPPEPTSTLPLRHFDGADSWSYVD